MMFADKKQNTIITFFFFHWKKTRRGYFELLYFFFFFKNLLADWMNFPNAFEILNGRIFIARIHLVFPHIFACLLIMVFNANHIWYYVSLISFFFKNISKPLSVALFSRLTTCFLPSRNICMFVSSEKATYILHSWKKTETKIQMNSKTVRTEFTSLPVILSTETLNRLYNRGEKSEKYVSWIWFLLEPVLKYFALFLNFS